MNNPEIRKSYFKDEYVIISPNRSKGAHKFEKLIEIESNKICYFCPQNFNGETITYRDDNENGDWEIISVINKFAVLSLDNINAYGQAEVLIETRKHGLDINDFSVDHIVRIFDAYINRYNELREINGVKYVIIFKNEGGKAGASVAHTHSQIIALPILPPKIDVESRAYTKYYLEHLVCPYCDIIKKETDSERVIWEDDNLFVLAPYASETPYEAWLIPKRHIRLISELNYEEKKSFATAMKLVLGKMDELGIAYNYFFENAVNNEGYHMHVKIKPRPNVWAGLELGTGVMINPIPPELAAEVYRGKVVVEDDPRF